MLKYFLQDQLQNWGKYAQSGVHSWGKLLAFESFFNKKNVEWTNNRKFRISRNGKIPIWKMYFSPSLFLVLFAILSVRRY